MSEHARPSRGAFLVVLAGLVGAALGAAVTGAVFWVLMARQQVRHEAELAAVGLGAAGLDALRQAAPGGGKPAAPSEEAQAKKFGEGFVADLEANRLASAYRSMTSEYQKKTDRKTFDALIDGYPQVQKLWSSRTEQVRKAAEGGGWEYYATCQEHGRAEPHNKVNFALILVKERDAWRVAELEITADSKKAEGK